MPGSCVVCQVMLSLSFARLACYHGAARPVSWLQMAMCWPRQPSIKSYDGSFGPQSHRQQHKRTFQISSSQHHPRDRRRLQVSLLLTDGTSSTGNVSYSGFYGPLCHFSATSVPRCCASKHKVHFKVSPFAAARSAYTDTGPRLVVLVVIYPKSSGKATLCGQRVLTGSCCQLSEGLFSLVYIQYVWGRFTNIKLYIYRSGSLFLIPALIIDCLIAPFDRLRLISITI